MRSTGYVWLSKSISTLDSKLFPLKMMSLPHGQGDYQRLPSSVADIFVCTFIWNIFSRVFISCWLGFRETGKLPFANMPQCYQFCPDSGVIFCHFLNMLEWGSGTNHLNICLVWKDKLDTRVEENCEKRKSERDDWAGWHYTGRINCACPCFNNINHIRVWNRNTCNSPIYLFYFLF